MIRVVLIVVFACNVLSQNREFRFDYEYSTRAGGWLKFHMIPGTWREARMRCDAEGAVLASPLTEQLKSAIIAFVTKHRQSVPTTIFTGVHASFSKGDYSSMEGIPLTRLSITWALGEPDNYNNAESCLAMLTDSRGSMSDVRCGDVLPYVCYKQYTDLTMSECGTTDSAYILDSRTGSCYKFHKDGTSWQQGYMTCVAEGGYLAVIDSEIEVEAVKKYTAKNPRQNKFSYWMGIGVHDWGERTTFMTIHGKEIDLSYISWFSEVFDNSSNSRLEDTGEYCGSIDAWTRLNDIFCNTPMPFLCEKKPSSLLTF